MTMRRYTVSIDEHAFVIDVVETAADRFEVSVDGQTFEATLHGDHELPGSVITPEIAQGEARIHGSHAAPSVAPATAPQSASPVSPGTRSSDRPNATRPEPRPGRGADRPAVGASKRPTRSGALTAPMPGVVLEVFVAAGTQLKRGDPVLVLEAMKMRNTIRSPRDAIVVDVLVAAGQPVGPGDTLVRLDETG